MLAVHNDSLVQIRLFTVQIGPPINNLTLAFHLTERIKCIIRAPFKGK